MESYLCQSLDSIYQSIITHANGCIEMNRIANWSLLCLDRWLMCLTPFLRRWKSLIMRVAKTVSLLNSLLHIHIAIVCYNEDDIFKMSETIWMIKLNRLMFRSFPWSHIEEVKKKHKRVYNKRKWAQSILGKKSIHPKQLSRKQCWGKKLCWEII